MKSARALHDGVELEFSGPVDAAAAAIASNFTAKRWNYKWARGYGSAHYSLVEPGRKGEDPVKVLSSSADGARVHVTLEDVRVVNQLALTYDLGGELKGEVLFTINQVPIPTTPR